MKYLDFARRYPKFLFKGSREVPRFFVKNNGEYTYIKTSSITRIKNGKTQFDQSFIYNIEQASGGKYATTQLYLGKGKFLVNLHPVQDKGAYTVGKEFAIINVYTGSLNMRQISSV